MPEQSKKGILEMCAEFLRELAVLVMVFYPIEDRLHLMGGLTKIFAVSALCLIAGIALEKVR